MKTFFLVSTILIAGIILSGCDHHHPASSAPLFSITGIRALEGQLVADTGTQIAKSAPLSSPQARDAGNTPSMYPVNGVTVQVLQNDVVLATTTTDAYGRFRFSNIAAGAYDLQVMSGTNVVAQYQAQVNADQTLTMYGRFMAGTWHWEHEWGPHWDDMPYGLHWGAGFCGASPGSGYWHDGSEWHEPGTGPHHGPHHW